MSGLGSAALIVASYFLGALPWGVVLGRLFQSTDLRRHGSGSTGTTNAYRVLGWRISVTVLALDFAKGMLPVILARWWTDNWWVIGACGVAATVGHCWSCFIRFSGGKGVATGGGAVIGMLPWLAVVILLMVGIVALTRYVSLASIAGAVIASVAAIIASATGHAPWPAAIAVVAISALIIERHRGNIDRLRSGTERRLRRRTAMANAG